MKALQRALQKVSIRQIILVYYNSGVGERMAFCLLISFFMLPFYQCKYLYFNIDKIVTETGWEVGMCKFSLFRKIQL